MNVRKEGLMYMFLTTSIYFLNLRLIDFTFLLITKNSINGSKRQIIKLK